MITSNILSLVLFVYVLRGQRMPRKLTFCIGGLGIGLILASIIGAYSIRPVDDAGLNELLTGTLPLVAGPYTALGIVALLKLGGLVAKAISYLRGSSNDQNGGKRNIVTLPTKDSTSLAKAA